MTSDEDNKTRRFFYKAFPYTKYMSVIGCIAQLLDKRRWEQKEKT